MADPVDVIIVGAGLSGLQAALSLHEAGRSVLVVEARDRVGGKTWSVPRPDGKGVQEFGAAWLNDTNQSVAWSYCEKFGLTPVVQNIKGLVASQDEDRSCHLFPFGELPKFEKDVVENITTLRDHVEAISLDPKTFQEPQRAQLDGISFEQWCRDAGAGPKALLTARVWCRGTTGQDPCDVSALSYLEVCRGASGVVRLRYDGKDGAQYLRLREGTQAISKSMAKSLPNGTVKLSTPVTSISRSDNTTYTVQSANNTVFTARKVISIPSPAYKSIASNPPLPNANQLYTSTVRYGSLTKYICLFATPFWRRKDACGLIQSFTGPMNHCRDTSVDGDENYALTCFLASGPGREWLTLSQEDRQEAVLKQISELFGVSLAEVKEEFLGAMTSEWMEDQWAGWGCPFAIAPPGAMGGFDVEGIAGKGVDGLYFVGTELTNEWRGYMEGALRSGKRGAELVLDSLRGSECERVRDYASGTYCRDNTAVAPDVL